MKPRRQDDAQAFAALACLYDNERMIGGVLHQATLNTVVANLTYLGLVMGFVFKDGLILPTPVLLCLPLPALGLGAYHLLQFGMANSHGASLYILEADLRERGWGEPAKPRLLA